MKEIEVKAKIQSTGALQEKLESMGCRFSSPLQQEDRIYFPKGMHFGDLKTGFACMRIRNSNGSFTWNMKKALSNELDNIEHETGIVNPEEAYKIIAELGYNEVVRVSKLRLKCKYDDLEICLDEVKGLGSFIEVEKLTDENADSKRVQDELFSFLKTLGVSKEDQVFKGYDTLTHEHQKREQQSK